jgi:hypothetical protein
MSHALRIQAITLPVHDLAAVEKFYRWTLRLKPAPERGPEHAHILGWGREDRVRLIDADAAPGAEQAITLRLPAMAVEELVQWCALRGLEPVALTVSPHDAEQLANLLPDVPLETFGEPESQNLSLVTVRGWADQRVELLFPLPRKVLTPRKQMGPFWWSSGDWSGLENPGLLGVTWGAPDIASGRRFCESLGIRPIDAEDANASHLCIGDQQFILEEREPAGITGLALVVPDGEIGVVKRTLEHLGADFRHADNRLITRDPTGRVVFVRGSRVR